MPITLSHAVVALPFVRTPLVASAVAIGAMTPDLPLFVRGTPLTYSFTHDPANILVMTAVAFVLFALWRVLLRPAVFELSSAWVGARLPEEWVKLPPSTIREALGMERVWRQLSVLVLSLVLGIATHLLADAFTHEGRWGVTAIPALAQTWGPLAGYKWLQHGVSVLGVVIIYVWLARWVRRRMPAVRRERIVPRWIVVSWALMLPALLVLAWVLGYLERGPFTPAFTPQHLAYATLPAAVGYWGLGTLALCITIAAAQRRRRRPEAGATQGIRP